MAATNSSAELRRLTEVIARQRDELDRLHHGAAARSVVDMAKGLLMERLSCPSAQAAEQLSRLAAEAGTPLPEMAAELICEQPPTPPPGGPGLPPGGPGLPGSALPLAAAAAESAGDGASLVAAVLDEALAPAGAVAAALWVLEPDGCLELIGESGFGPLTAARWRRIPPDMDCPAQRVLQGGGDVWWSMGPPDGVPYMGHWLRGARAVLALREARGATTGAMEVCWPGPLPDFPGVLRRQLGALAAVCAEIVGTRLADGQLSADGRVAWLFGLLGGLVDSALFAYAVRDQAGQVTDFRIAYVSESFRDPAGRGARELAGRTLLEAYPATARADGLFDRAVQALATGTPQHLTGAVATALARDATAAAEMEIRVARLYDGVVIAWRPADEAIRLGSLLEHAQRLGRIGAWEENVITGDVHWTNSTFALFGMPAGQRGAISLANLDRFVVADDVSVLRRFREALLRGTEATGATFRLVRPGDESVRQMRIFAETVTDAGGAVVALRGAFQDLSAQYHTQVALVASEQRADEEHRLALRLQQAIMPATAQPVELSGIDVAVRYRPAAPEHLVGGDWYDTVVLPSKEVLLVVGDIAGHGIDAVTGMIAMRNCLRGLAITGAGPAQLLDWLNGVACHLMTNMTATVVCGRYNRATRTLHWARAGHLPPVLVRDGTARALPLPHGALLGLDPSSSYEEATTSLRPGDGVLMFTDGLIERREIAIDDAVDALARTAGRPVVSAAGFADRVLAEAASDTRDDVCLVAVRIL